MTEPPTPPETDGPPSPPALGPALLKVAAAVMLVIPAAGIVWHAVVYLTFDVEAVIRYGGSRYMQASAIVAFANLLGNWFHYRHTRMTVDLASRVLTYLWVISMVLLWVRVQNG